LPDALATCMACGKHITWRKSVCDACETAYDLRGAKRLWPAWAKRLHADYVRQRRSELRQLVYESDLPYAELVKNLRTSGEFNSDGD
jgi:hypothetical protein